MTINDDTNKSIIMQVYNDPTQQPRTESKSQKMRVGASTTLKRAMT